jgi:hypothetical protein
MRRMKATMGRKRLWITLAAVVLGVSCAGPAALASGGGKPVVPAWVKQFPLGMDIPVKKYLPLEEGVVRERRWEVFAFRAKGANSSSHMCLDIGSLYFGSGSGGQFQSGYTCGLVTEAGNPVLNESGFSIKKSFKTPTVSSTVIAGAVSSDVASVRFRLKPGPNRREQIHLVGSKEAQRADLASFGFVTIDPAHKACVRSVEEFAQDGSLEHSGPVRNCGG